MLCFCVRNMKIATHFIANRVSGIWHSLFGALICCVKFSIMSTAYVIAGHIRRQIYLIPRLFRASEYLAAFLRCSSYVFAKL